MWMGSSQAATEALEYFWANTTTPGTANEVSGSQLHCLG